MGDLLEQTDMLQRKHLGNRVIKKIAESDVDFGHVKHQEHRDRAGQRNTKVHPVKAVTGRSQHRTSRSRGMKKKLIRWSPNASQRLRWNQAYEVPEVFQRR